MSIFKHSKLLIAVSLSAGSLYAPSAFAANCDANVYPDFPQVDWQGLPSHANANDIMVHENNAYKANWYTNSIPGTQDGSWTFLEACGAVTPNEAPTTTVAAQSTALTGDSVAISATPTDSDGTIASVAFSVDGTQIALDTSAPFSANWNAVQGSHSITAVATDDDGATSAVATTSIDVTDPITPNEDPTAVVSVAASALTGDNVAITASAADSDGTVASVAFSVDGTLISTDTTAPYSANWTAVVGSHSITAVATDNEGATSVISSASINVTDPVVGNVAPTASISAATSGETGDSIAISATAADSDGSVASVAFSVDGALISTDSTAPYSANWTATAGSHTLSAVATDNEGATSAASVSGITITDPVIEPNILPTASVSASATATTDDVVSVTATAADSDGTVASVSFYADGALISTDNTSPYAASWTAVVGTHSLSAIAVDNEGGASSESTTSIVVSNAVVTPPPSGGLCADVPVYPEFPEGQIDYKAGNLAQINQVAYAAKWSTTTEPGSDGSWEFSHLCYVPDPDRPNPADSVNLELKGFPSTLALGSYGAANANNALAAAKVDLVSFDSPASRGTVVEPSDVVAAMDQARNVEALSGKPVTAVIGLSSVDAASSDADILTYSNLVTHYQNLIRSVATVQSYKDANHESPAAIVLNQDLLGAWAQNSAAFDASFGTDGAFTNISVKQALQEAINAESSYQLANAQGSLSSAYSLSAISNAVDSALSDDILGWVKSQNFIVSQFAPDATFGWVVDTQNKGNSNWMHVDFPGQRRTWEGAGKYPAMQMEALGIFADANYAPDFIAFDTNDNDGLSTLGKVNHAFGPQQWKNFLNVAKQVTDYFATPGMFYQVSGGHLAAASESLGSYDVASQSAVAATYLLGDKNIGTNTANIRSDVLGISLDSATYGASNVSALLAQKSDHDWGGARLRHAAFANIFAISFGSNDSTGVHNDNGWLSGKISAYQASPMPLYYVPETSASTPLTAVASLNTSLESISATMDNEVFLYEVSQGKWEPSSIYKWDDFLVALKAMHNEGVEDTKFWLTDPTADDATNEKYAKVAIAAFLSQSMQETIRYDACDENNWTETKYGSVVDYTMGASCGQLGQQYADYGQNAQGVDSPYSCPRTPDMEVTALTHARWYGAPAPIFAAPDAVLEDEGLMVNGSVGRWSIADHCNVSPTEINGEKQAWERDTCEVYPGQKAGKFIWDGSAQETVEGCGWWGRGVIQTTGRLNFGKLNHFIGRSHVDPENVGQTIAGTEVKAAPANPLYADMDLCSSPELICSTTEHKEIKWIAGLFFWMNEVQGYNDVGGPYADWNYFTELKAYVDGGLVGTKFVDGVSGIVNRGCPDDHCPVSGEVHAIGERQANFNLALQKMGLNPQ